MIQSENTTVEGTSGRAMAVDVRWSDEIPPRAVVLFAHGYKGFKDWGCWNLIADAFALKGIAFAKFNFSHNGTTLENPQDFADLDAFAQNNYSIECADLESVINALPEVLPEPLRQLNVHLIGHSRGGGIVLLVGSRHPKVKSMMTWAAVSDFGARFPMGDELEDWKSSGVFYVKNARTGQELPHDIQWWNDFVQHESQLDIRSAVFMQSKPLFIAHAADDQAVHMSEAMKLARWCPTATLRIFESGGHTFGAKHPWTEDELPEESIRLVEETLNFLK